MTDPNAPKPQKPPIPHDELRKKLPFPASGLLPHGEPFALIDTIVINIQTLTYHGLMIVVGIYTAVWLGKRFNLKIYSKTPVPFLAFIVVAMILNVTFVKSGITGGSTFNMFFISPYFPSTLPVLSEIYPVVPYPIFLLLYVLGFITLGFIFFEILYWTLWVIRKLEPKKKAEAVTEQP